MHPLDALPKHSNLSINEILSMPCPRLWYLYNRYLELMTYVAVDKSPDPLPELVEERGFSDWEEATALPDWRVKQIMDILKDRGLEGRRLHDEALKFGINEKQLKNYSA